MPLIAASPSGRNGQRPLAFVLAVAGCVLGGCDTTTAPTGKTKLMQAIESFRPERQITRASCNHILTNTRVWSPDGQWIVYDTRSDAAGDLFDGSRIEMVHARTGETRLLHESRNGAHCGVASFHPREHKIAFILGPENPTVDWTYNAWHRQGVIVEAARPGAVRNLDARDLTPPFTPGALRGGTHVHIWDAGGDWLSFTYEDHVLAQFKQHGPDHDTNLRNIGVCAPVRSVRPAGNHPRNHPGDYFSVLVSRTVAEPKPGSDEIKRAFEEAWIGTNGYLRPDGTRQPRALAFQGHVITTHDEMISEVFLVDLPEDLTQPGDAPLAGTETRSPAPPHGTSQRRLTFTDSRKFPGIQVPRHWLRSSPDGSRIAFLMRDEAGVVQLWSISPNGGAPAPITRNPWSIASSFNWSPDGTLIACTIDNSIFLIDASTGQATRLTPRSPDATAPRPEACVFSPDGKSIAFVRRLPAPEGMFNQILVIDLE